MKKGKLKEDYSDRIIKAFEAGKALPQYKILTVNSLYLNNGGAYIAQELGYALSWGNDLLSHLTDKDFDIDSVANSIQFNLGHGTNYF